MSRSLRMAEFGRMVHAIPFSCFRLLEVAAQRQLQALACQSGAARLIRILESLFGMRFAVIARERS